MLNQPIAVLGGGNFAHVMAADLTLGGYDVNFYDHPTVCRCAKQHCADSKSFQSNTGNEHGGDTRSGDRPSGKG